MQCLRYWLICGAIKLRTPRNFHTPGRFDYEGYLARRDIYLTAFVWNDNEIKKRHRRNLATAPD